MYICQVKDRGQVIELVAVTSLPEALSVLIRGAEDARGQRDTCKNHTHTNSMNPEAR